MFEIKELTKYYENDRVLNHVSLNISKGMNFIVGASGSGKTTLLKIMSGMEKDFEGSITYCGKDIKSFSDNEKSALYNHTFGFIWQDFHLLENATVKENIMLSTYLNKNNVKINEIIQLMQLDEIYNQKVKFLSGGQKQRVAIARELMKNPQVIFCDEPTSALDSENTKIIMNILRKLSKSKTLIIVTHDTSLIHSKDTVFELDKGELVSNVQVQSNNNELKELKSTMFSFKDSIRIAICNFKNKPVRYLCSLLSLIISATLLLTTFGNSINQSSQNEFNQLIETYGEGLLDIELVGSFMSASGGNSEDLPQGSVNQDLSGYYEKYQDDERVEFIVPMQAFENIKIQFEGKMYTVEKTGSSPVLTRLVVGSIPSEEEYQVVIPLKFAQSIGLSPDDAIGKTIDFSATIFQWVDNHPLEKPIYLQARICGVSDNTVVYDYEGQQYSYTVDDSFFFNKSAIDNIRQQAGIENQSVNFTIRAHSPEDLISLKDELNKSGIVPIGRFELVEELVRLNQQTSTQTESSSIIISILAILLVLIPFMLTSILRKKEYAIYKISGYNDKQLTKLLISESLILSLISIFVFIIIYPLLNTLTLSLFNASILSLNQFILGSLIIISSTLVSVIVELPALKTTSYRTLFQVGDYHD